MIFPFVRGCLWATRGWLGTAREKFRESTLAFIADLMGPIYQISPGTFFGSLDVWKAFPSFSQLASTGAQTSSQRGKLTPFPCPPHGEGEGIILYEIS